MQCLRILIPLLLAAASCGGTVQQSNEHGPSLGNDAGRDAVAETAAADAIVSETSVTDSASGEFCEGASKLQLGSSGTIVLQPAITTSELIMDCCEGGVVRFHTQGVVGYGIEVIARVMGGNLKPGEYALGEDAGGLEVTIGKQGDWSNASRASGTLQVQSSYPEPLQLGFCLRTEPEAGLDPIRVFVPGVLVAPWTWYDRWAMYLLADSSVTAEQALQVPIGELVLASEPLVSLQSLAYYEHGGHRAHWDSWASTQGLLNMLPPIGVNGVPFVLAADHERIYVGAFTSAISSVVLSAPSIRIDELSDEGFRIDAPPPGLNDPRADPRILQVLSESMKLAP